MAWLEKLNSAANVKSKDATAHYPFAEERVYWQLDLDGRDAVEGLAQYYIHNACPGFFGSKIIEQLEEQRQKDVGSVAVY